MDDRAEFIATLKSSLAQLDLQLEDGAAAQMWEHFQLLVAANRKINLTRITDPAEAAARHYADSLAVAAWCRASGTSTHLNPRDGFVAADPRVGRRADFEDRPAGAPAATSRPNPHLLGRPSTRTEVTTVLDIGTGGGFPAVPLAICRPDWQVTAIDGTGKKIRCLEQFVDRLGLTNCQALRQRAEEWGEDAPSFDMVLFRAIAPLADCLGLAERFCRPGTVVICYKGDPLPNEEARAARRCRAGRSFARRQHWPYTLKSPGGVLSRQLCCYFTDPEHAQAAGRSASDA